MELVPESERELEEGLGSFVADIAVRDLDGLGQLHPTVLAEHRLCAAKAELILKTKETKGFQSNLDQTEDDYYRGLIPDDLRGIEEELTGFAKDLATMDMGELFMVLKLVTYEFRLAKVKVELIEKRMQALRPPPSPAWAAPATE